MMEKDNWKIIFCLSLIPYVVLLIYTYANIGEGLDFFLFQLNKIQSFLFVIIVYQCMFFYIFIPSLICQLICFNRFVLKKMEDVNKKDILGKLFVFSFIIYIILYLIINYSSPGLYEEDFLFFLILYIATGTATLILPMCIIYQVQYIKHKKHLKETKKKEE